MSDLPENKDFRIVFTSSLEWRKRKLKTEMFVWRFVDSSILWHWPDKSVLSHDGVTSLCKYSFVSESRKVFPHVNGGTYADAEQSNI